MNHIIKRGKKRSAKAKARLQKQLDKEEALKRAEEAKIIKVRRERAEATERGEQHG